MPPVFCVFRQYRRHSRKKQEKDFIADCTHALTKQSYGGKPFQLKFIVNLIKTGKIKRKETIVSRHGAGVAEHGQSRISIGALCAGYFPDVFQISNFLRCESQSVPTSFIQLRTPFFEVILALKNAPADLSVKPFFTLIASHKLNEKPILEHRLTNSSLKSLLLRVRSIRQEKSLFRKLKLPSELNKPLRNALITSTLSDWSIWLGARTS